VLIHYSATGEDHDTVLFRKSDWQFAPMNQIAADGVAPTHVAPAVAEWIELEEQMILVIEVDQAVGIVGPIASGREMKLRTIGFLICVSLAEKGQRGDEERCGESRRQDLYSLSRGKGTGGDWWLVTGRWWDRPDASGDSCVWRSVVRNWLRALVFPGSSGVEKHRNFTMRQETLSLQ
jgi:hypothetical protein